MIRPGRAANPPVARPERPVPFPDADTPLYSVGQVADMLDVQPAFLRRLDTEQVVMPSRSSGGQRRYSRTDIDRVHAVTGLLAEGMTLGGALRIMELQAEIADLRRQLAARRAPR
jgi:MerR family transcriptional regulator/heat shock protein HspR